MNCFANERGLTVLMFFESFFNRKFGLSNITFAVNFIGNLVDNHFNRSFKRKYQMACIMSSRFSRAGAVSPRTPHASQKFFRSCCEFLPTTNFCQTKIEELESYNSRFNNKSKSGDFFRHADSGKVWRTVKLSCKDESDSKKFPAWYRFQPGNPNARRRFDLKCI